VLDATLCFCPGEGKQCAFDEATNELIGSDDDAIWESGDVGGFECYIAADEGGEEEGPDAEYDDEDDTELLSVSASNNTPYAFVGVSGSGNDEVEIVFERATWGCCALCPNRAEQEDDQHIPKKFTIEVNTTRKIKRKVRQLEYQWTRLRKPRLLIPFNP